MSRFKLFSLMAAVIASISNNENLTKKEKAKELSGLRSPLSFSNGSPFVQRKLNQRQIRKRRRQNPHSKKWAA